MTLAQQLNQALGAKSDVLYTGHSLGGGLASAAAVVTGRSAVTFNAAGLNERTVERFLGAAPSMTNENIQAYYVVGDAVSLLQDFTPLPNAVGQRIPLMPRLPGIVMTPIGLHLMSQVKASINEP
jgi:type VI secretion system secreted protein VgrG